jgi:nitrite reductase/ring-hydroxylating ferredoxin subunit
MAHEYKLKGVSSLDLKNGEKQEAEIEGVEGCKVLLLKIQDQVHATSSNCTHYGAPLVKGVLTPEGRLTCPWHGGQQYLNSLLCTLLTDTSLLQGIYR